MPNSAQLMALLPFPDWSTLRIRRGDSLIEVNLQDAIDACDDSTTPEQARDWDRSLQWGDVVEVRVKSMNDPWSGFSAETCRLFQKALQREVVFQDSTGLVRSVVLSYVPAHYLNGASGPIAVPTGDLENGKVSIPRADAFVQSFSGDSKRTIEVYRGDEQLTKSREDMASRW